jgi:putative DNA primase/helicase
MNFDAIIAKLDNVKPAGNGKTARCPGHDDRANSLSITPAGDRILINCFAGCSSERICAALGIDVRDLFYEQRNGYPINGAAAKSALTLSQFAKAKGFEVEFLAANGVSEEKGGLVFHYLLMNGQRAARQRIRLALSGQKRFIWNKAEGRPVPYGLWKIEAWTKAGLQDLVLCEGESDALSFWFHGMAAIGIPGADQCSLIQAPHVARFRRVIIAKENDQGGETFAKGCAGRLAELEFDGKVLVAEIGRMHVKDSNELHVKMLGDAGGFEAAWNCLIEDASEIELPRVGLDITCAADVKTSEIRWLWPRRIALGKVCVWAGDPGIGKTFVSQDMAARLSVGAAWPDGSANQLPPSGTLIFSGEDDAADTIVPRLRAAGADLSKIYISQLVRKALNGEIVSRGFDLSTDLPELEVKLKRYRDVIRAVVIDPFSAYLGRTDSYKNAELRGAVLEPLARLAALYNVAVILITHFNKSAGDALNKISGSVALAAAARIVWLFMTDPERPDRTLMLLRKMNIAKSVSGLAFSIVEDETGSAAVAWSDEPIDRDADELMRARDDANRPGAERLDQACALLREILSDGELHLSTEVTDRCRELGISEKTFRRARALLGVSAHKTGTHANLKWWLSLHHP